MNTNFFLLSCVLMAILIANMPMAKAVSCNDDNTADDCTDCTLAENAASPDCVATTTASSWAETTTERRHKWGLRGRRGRRGSNPIFNFFF